MKCRRTSRRGTTFHFIMVGCEENSRNIYLPSFYLNSTFVTKYVVSCQVTLLPCPPSGRAEWGSFNNVHMADLRQVAYSRGQNSRWAPLPCEVTRETAPDTRRAKRRPGSLETAWRAPRSQVHRSRLTQAQHTHSLVVCFCFHTIPPAAQCVQPKWALKALHSDGCLDTNTSPQM